MNWIGLDSLPTLKCHKILLRDIGSLSQSFFLALNRRAPSHALFRMFGSTSSFGISCAFIVLSRPLCRTINAQEMLNGNLVAHAMKLCRSKPGKMAEKGRDSGLKPGKLQNLIEDIGYVTEQFVNTIAFDI